MSGIVPDTQQDAINFFSSRMAAWAANATAIGLTTAQVTAFASLVNAAQTKRSAAQVARNASKTATLDLGGAMQSMRTVGGDLIKTIRAYAETTGNNSVYLLSNIPPVAPPTPLGPPEAPTQVRAVLNSDGQIEIKWDGTRVGGTSFRVERSITPVAGAPSDYALLNVVEERSYLDTQVPQGVAAVSYKIKAQRAGGTSVGSQPAQVTFGTSPGTSPGSSAGEHGELGLAA